MRKAAMMLDMSHPQQWPEPLEPQRFRPDSVTPPSLPFPSNPPTGHYYGPPPRYVQNAYPQPYPPAVNVFVPQKKSCPHVMQAVLTFLTCGLWLPVWIIDAIAKSG